MKKRILTLSLALAGFFSSMACGYAVWTCGDDVTPAQVEQDAAKNCPVGSKINWYDCDGSSGYIRVR